LHTGVSSAFAAARTALEWRRILFARKILLAVLNTVVSLAIFTLLFTAIYKVLPDTPIPWRDLVLGAFVTAVLFAIGKSLIGIYLGRAAPSSPYGAAGALIILMFWTYYSAQIFLFGAELTKAIADERAPADRRARKGGSSERPAGPPAGEIRSQQAAEVDGAFPRPLSATTSRPQGRPPSLHLHVRTRALGLGLRSRSTTCFGCLLCKKPKRIAAL
jgi:hypothetical protein